MMLSERKDVKCPGLRLLLVAGLLSMLMHWAVFDLTEARDVRVETRPSLQATLNVGPDLRGIQNAPASDAISGRESGRRSPDLAAAGSFVTADVSPVFVGPSGGRDLAVGMVEQTGLFGERPMSLDENLVAYRIALARELASKDFPVKSEARVRLTVSADRNPVSIKVETLDQAVQIQNPEFDRALEEAASRATLPEGVRGQAFSLEIEVMR